MTTENPNNHKEIIIVRRASGGDHDEHHGGVWKIAYADFMTAMMAFFLVMWLINAANEETRAAVASYFNPIKLVDRQKQSRGLEQSDAASSNNEDMEKEEAAAGSPSAEKTQSADTKIFDKSADQMRMMNEPYETLDQIAEVEQGTAAYFDGEGGENDGGPRQGADLGKAYQDPFSPEYWNENVSPEKLSLAQEVDVEKGENAGHALKIQSMLQFGNGQPLSNQDDYLPIGGQQNAIATQPSPSIGGLGGDVAGSGQENQQQQKPQEAIIVEKQNLTTTDAIIDSDKQEINKVQASETIPEIESISRELAKLLDKQTQGPHPLVQVLPINDGIAIELMDQSNYGMFSIGSAKPDKKTIDLLSGIAKILSKKQGDVVVSGHTDARPYRTATYDNWQLSTARAQMAYYMLVRGGLDEGRILRVEGYANRQLKNKKDPLAAENRRIEILLRTPTITEQTQNNGQSSPTVPASSSKQNDNTGRIK